MDLSLLLLSGLVAAGYYANKDGKIIDEPPKRTKIDENEKPSGENIYNSYHWMNTRDTEQRMVNDSWEKSLDPINTNIIPWYYNQLPHVGITDQNVFKQELLNRAKVRDMNAINNRLQNNLASNINSGINPQNRGSELLLSKNSVLHDGTLSGGWYGISNPDQPLPEAFQNTAQCIPPARWDTNILGVPSIPGTTGLIPQTNTSAEEFDKYGYICPGDNPKLQAKNGYVPTAPNWTQDARTQDLRGASGMGFNGANGVNNNVHDRPNGTRVNLNNSNAGGSVGGSSSALHEGFNPTISGPQQSFTAPFHNNMVPFFSGRTRQNMDPEANRRRLENFTGNGDESTQFRFVHKRELDRNDLFKPVYGTSFVYGKPNIDGYGRDRYASNVSQIQTKVSPIESVRVGPGMNYGPGAEGHDGFHPWFRTPQKTVNDLRVNPKLTYGGRIIQGADPVSRRGILGQAFKNRPDTFYINGPERYFTTTGQWIKQMAPQDFKTNMHHTNRPETSIEYAGPAKIAQGDETYATPTFRIPRTQNFLQINPSGVNAQNQQPVDYDYGRSGYYGRDIKVPQSGDPCGVWARGQERDDTETCRGNQRLNTFFASGSTQHFQDEAKETKVETLPSWKRYGGVGNQQMQATTQHYQDTAKTTKIETTPSWKRPGGVGTGQLAGATLQWQDTAKTTKQETLPDWKRPGGVGTGQLAGATLPWQDEAKTTKIETTPSWKRYGIVGTGQIAGLTLQWQDTAKTTKQETLPDWKRPGGAGTAQTAAATLPWQDEAKTTKTETLPTWKRYGGAGTGQLAGATQQWQDQAKTTKQETLPEWKRPGGVGTGQIAAATLQCQDEQRTTKKQITSNRYQNYVGGSAVSQGNSAPMSYESAFNAEIDDRKESTLQGRRPTGQGVKNAAGVCNMNMSIKHKDRYDTSIRNLSNEGGDRQFTAIRDKYMYGQLGSGLNKLPINGLRQPEDVLVEQFRRNPYTQPLDSVAAY